MELIPPFVSEVQVREKKTHTRILKVWAPVPAFHLISWVILGNSFVRFQIMCMISLPYTENCAWSVGI